MTSVLASPVAISVSNGLAAGADSPPIDAVVESSPTVATLLLLDDVISLAAACSAFAFCVWWVVRCRSDPLAAAPDRPNKLDETAIIGPVLVYMVAAVAIFSVMRFAGATDQEPLDPIQSGLAGTAAQLVGLAACMAYVSNRFVGGVGLAMRGPRGFPRRWHLLAAPLLTIVAVGLCPRLIAPTMYVIQVLAPQYVFEQHTTFQALGDADASIWTIVALWAGAVLVAPVAEEFFFRGLLQTFLGTVLRSRWAAIGLSSVAFAIAHISQPETIPALLMFSVMLGFAYERRGSLLAPIVMHVLFNVKAMVWMTLGDAG